MEENKVETVEEATVVDEAAGNVAQGTENGEKRRFNKGNRPNGKKPFQRRQREESEFEDQVVKINRVTKVVKGGRRYRFAALVVIGDKKGRVGLGTGKANEVPDAIRKAKEAAQHNLINVPIINTTLPHEVIGVYGACKVLIRPAAAGTGVIAGGPVRAVMELAGIGNVLTKCLGSRTKINMIRATFDGLKQMKTLEEVSKVRGLKPSEVRH